MPKQKKNVRIWTATKDAKAGMMVTETHASMVADRNNFVTVGPQGPILSGKGISMVTLSENIREGGLFVKMNDLVQMIPTTLVTPMPAHVPFPPLGFASGLIKDMPFFLALIGVAAIPL